MPLLSGAKARSYALIAISAAVTWFLVRLASVTSRGVRRTCPNFRKPCRVTASNASGNSSHLRRVCEK